MNVIIIFLDSFRWDHVGIYHQGRAPFDGKSFLPVLKGESNEHRPAIITGFYEASDRCIRDKRWSYIIRPKGEPDALLRGKMK